MSQEYPNCYQRARRSTFLTQEEAAERLAISPESLKAYEGGKRVPPDDVVARMCAVYDVPWLALEHMSDRDELGVLPEVAPKPLPMASIALTNRLRSAADRLGGLLQIAEDGVIDETERPAFDEIVEDLRETIAAAYQVIYAEETKKERPEAGTSKRSCSRRASENHCMNSLSQPRGNVKTFSSQGVRA